MAKPNILFIFADQLCYSAMACNGNRIVRTPSFDRLAREGVIFDQAFSSCPICSPYRGQILTGRYSHVNGVICNEYSLFDNQATIAHVLKNEGYRTAFIGKWHLGYPPYTEHMRYGFDDLYAYNCSHSYYNISYWHNEEGPFRMVDFAPRVETQLALDYIKEHHQKSPDQPFCVFIGWGPPHWNSVGGRDYGQYPQEYGIYDPEEVDVPGNVPIQFRDFAKKEIADYYGMVTALDACMQRVLEALDEWGLSEDTIICLSSDHGDHLSSHGYGKPGDMWMHHTLRGSKATPYEESVHIPFILRYPRAEIKANHRTDTMLNSVDVLPTLLNLCDIPVPDDVQGKDLSHAVLGIPGEEPDSVYLQILGPGWPTRTKWLGLWRGVRTHQYTYARWKDRDGMRVLYDLRRDPLEMRNLIDDTEYTQVAQQMEERLQRWIKETHDPFDTGRRLPVTEMLDLGQSFNSTRWHQSAPEEYVKALEKIHSREHRTEDS
jgi:arylsulfatase A-like enzyme